MVGREGRAVGRQQRVQSCSEQPAASAGGSTVQQHNFQATWCGLDTLIARIHSASRSHSRSQPVAMGGRWVLSVGWVVVCGG